MDTDTPKTFPDFLGALRPKAQILMEEWGSLDQSEIRKSNNAKRAQPLPPYETWTKLKLPYLASSAPPLPSTNELIAAVATNKLGEKNRGTPICRIGDNVVKFSTSAAIFDEVENIFFLTERCPQLRIPKIVAVWTDVTTEGKVAYCFMMEFIEGIQLDTVTLADMLPVHAQDIVCAKLSAQIQLLRSIPSEGYYGRVHRQGWLEQPTALKVGPEPTICGPFNTYEEFVSAMFYSWEKHEALNNSSQEWSDKYKSKAAELWSLIADCKPHEPKFTWLDPKLANIIVQPIQKDDGTEDWDVVLIDWEYAGWYPAWVQAMQVELSLYALEYDRTQAQFGCGRYPTNSYRGDELSQMVLDGFDPNPSWRNLEEIQRDRWWFM